MTRFEKQKEVEREDHKEKHNEETMDEIRLRAKEECHYLKRVPAGDEAYYWCELSAHPCEMEYNNFGECEEHADFVKELIKEREEK